MHDFIFWIVHVHPPSPIPPSWAHISCRVHHFVLYVHCFVLDSNALECEYTVELFEENHHWSWTRATTVFNRFRNALKISLEESMEFVLKRINRKSDLLSEYINFSSLNVCRVVHLLKHVRIFCFEWNGERERPKKSWIFLWTCVEREGGAN